ncbi:hypothetical protein C8Q70DRAFT_909236 [Cubamyces menziesii]|nr:hypothetical protein C8Q70DRAFT_909236 [Cubamyces menziesii]
MNGSLSRGRQSVWALLDNLRLKSLTSPASGSPSPSSGDDADAGAASPGSTSRTSLVSTVEDDDSVMFYGPLVPDASSQVELARSEIVSVDENGVVVDVLLDDAPLPDSTALPKVRFGGLWPFTSRPGTAAGAATPSAPASSPTQAKPKPKVLVEKRLWVPSTTQLSLQVMWWGYRLWLPPPVMNLLNDKEIEAAKVGAMLTTALQWLLNNVPASALPPTLQPALALVRSLVPYLGYIGGFVAWSWGALKGFDVGNGVTLTATWLLPIALIPGTWEDSDVPQPQPQPPSGGGGGSSSGGTGTTTPPTSTPSGGDPSSATPPSGTSPPSGSSNPSAPISGTPTTPSGGSSTSPGTAPDGGSSTSPTTSPKSPTSTTPVTNKAPKTKAPKA